MSFLYLYKVKNNPNQKNTSSQQNEQNLSENGDFYITPEGYKCFTEQYHLKRGYCCQSGCRHCPYGFDKKISTFKKK